MHTFEGKGTNYAKDELIQQLQQQNETLQASLDNCLRQNQEMLEMLKIAINNINDDEDEFVIQASALITKIEKGE